ncbi:hypothetical protein [Terribacillus sp. JSM ZJ617]|uniref:hypothetical protein n=1 Tax=Terribacillus sp. JSM ZJ617 TaxID=3342119 RepID=UPI0035A921DF
MKELKQQDFAAFRSSLESDRQSIESLRIMIIVSIILTAILFSLTYIVVFDYSTFPNKEIIREYHLWITVGITFFSLIFSFPSISKKYQRLQYLLTIIISQNLFGWIFFMAALLSIGRLPEVDESKVISLAGMLITAAILVLVLTLLRLLILLNRGAFRIDSNKVESRSKWESLINSKKPIIMVGSVGLALIIISILNSIDINYIQEIFIFVISSLIFLAMQFVLPEQLIILYCKIRFKSFNYSKNGNLFPYNSSFKRTKKKKGLNP